MKNFPDGNAYSEAGKSLHAKKKYDLAIAEFRKALEEFNSGGAAAAVAEMKNNIGVCLQMLGKPDEALREIVGTAEVFAKQGSLEHQAMALGNEASALEDLNRFDEALEKYHQADKLLENESKSEIRAIILKRISTIELKRGDRLASLASMNIALHIDPDPSSKEKSLKQVLSKFFQFFTK